MGDLVTLEEDSGECVGNCDFADGNLTLSFR